MDALSTPSRSRTYDILKPEEDLAEWTNRIKALQRQVDADDEAEQRRLEEEIAAARRARLRRSRGAESVANADPSRIGNETSMSPSPFDVGHTVPEKQIHHADALRRLEHNGQYSANDAERPLTLLSKIQQPDAMSLAAFIGGRATGPRLNKHAPQPDATDPTQFEQRTNIAAPHPVFGRGGIAMPGLVGQRPSAVRSHTASKVDQRSQPSIATRSHTPPVVKKYIEKVGERTITPQKTEDGETAVRTEIIVTQWAGTNGERIVSQRPCTQEQAIFPHKAGEREQLRQNTISRERAISTPAVSYSTREGGRPSSRASERKNSQYTSVRAGTPSSGRATTSSPSPSMVSSVNVRHFPGSPNASPSVQKLPVTPPYLSRSIQSESHRLAKPAINPSIDPSPAFMKPPAPKEPTPSISRLQGRGFVQSMVKISSRLESPTVAPPAPPTKPRAARKSSVLDRWQPVMASRSTPSPPVSPKSVTFSMAVTSPPSITSNLSRPSSTEPVKRLLRTRASLPSISQGLTEASGAELERNASLLRKMPPDGTPGLGSATTMAIYKPSSSPETEFSNVDELGVRKQPLGVEEVGKTHVSTELSSPSGKPLSHPTKDRVKKPRKVKNMRIANQEQWKVRSIQGQEPAIQPPSSHAAAGSETPKSIAEAANKVPGSRSAASSITSSTPIPTTSSKRRDDAVVRHSRSSSAGNRPTAMDVALAFGQQPENNKVDPPPASPEYKVEKRKSTLEKYSSIMLPALKEEPTPTTSPSGTLSRNIIPSQANDKSKIGQPDLFSGTPKVVHLNHGDEPLLNIKIDELLESRLHIELSKPHIQTISVELLNVIGTTTTAISENTNIFYSTELLAIVHRFKSNIDGLVSTTLWIWRGRQSQVGEKEEHKIHELARRYGTDAEIVNQSSEPPQLVYLLGGWLAIRQGSRNRWSPENTTMHLVRQNGSVVYIDELDLSVKNLCSAFSYCLSILNTIYIWHGCGAIQAERRAALQYAQSFIPKGQQAVELNEGEGDDDEMFWMILGGQDYAKADYWRWRKESLLTDPITWRVQAKEAPLVVSQVFLLPSQASFHEGVYIIDCIWEFFVLVGCRARGNRQDIRLGLDVAMNMSKRLSPNRPFPPTVHVLVLPSQLPLDLRLNCRNFDEEALNDGNVPDHMNILSAAEASEHLQRTSWETTTLEDEGTLPYA